MAGNFEGIRTRNLGIEIEMTGLTRCQAAKAIAKVLEGSPNHVGGSYDKYTVRDEKGRDWSIIYDGGIKCVDANGHNVSKSYSTNDYILLTVVISTWSRWHIAVRIQRL